MHFAEGETNACRGQRGIILWQRWTRNDGGIRGVLGSHSRRAVVTDTLLLSICILFPKALKKTQKPSSMRGARR